MMLLDLILDWRLWSALFATSVIAVGDCPNAYRVRWSLWAAALFIPLYPEDSLTTELAQVALSWHVMQSGWQPAHDAMLMPAAHHVWLLPMGPLQT